MVHKTGCIAQCPMPNVCAIKRPLNPRRAWHLNPLRFIFMPATKHEHERLNTPAPAAPLNSITAFQYCKDVGIHPQTLVRWRRCGNGPKCFFDDRGKLMVVVDAEGRAND